MEITRCQLINDPFKFQKVAESRTQSLSISRCHWDDWDDETFCFNRSAKNTSGELNSFTPECDGRVSFISVRDERSQCESETNSFKSVSSHVQKDLQIFVGGLDNMLKKSTNEACSSLLLEHFSKYGKVVDVHVHSTSSSYAFVTFSQLYSEQPLELKPGLKHNINGT